MSIDPKHARQAFEEWASTYYHPDKKFPQQAWDAWTAARLSLLREQENQPECEHNYISMSVRPPGATKSIVKTFCCLCLKPKTENQPPVSVASPAAALDKPIKQLEEMFSILAAFNTGKITSKDANDKLAALTKQINDIEGDKP